MAGALLEMQLAKQLYPDKKKKEAVVVQAVQKTVEAQYIYIYIFGSWRGSRRNWNLLVQLAVARSPGGVVELLLKKAVPA